jgi:hypothetical protein
MPIRAHNTNGKKSQTSNQYPNQANIILTDDHEAVKGYDQVSY